MASTDLPRILISGIDTLHLFCRAALCESRIEQLLAQKEAARRAGPHDPPQRTAITAQPLVIKPHGARNATLLLDSEHMALKLAPGAPRNLPPSTLELRSLFLWQLGAVAAVAAGGGVVGGVTLPTAADFPGPTLHVSRIDLTVDFQGWIPEVTELDRFVTRAEERRSFHNRTGFTGFMFGRGDVAARLYDKTAEIRKSGKAWFRDLWRKAPAFAPDAPVWRLEYQLRRPALRSFACGVGAGPLDTWEDVRGAVAPLWRYLAGRWLALRAARTSRTRQVLTPTWQALHDGAFADGTWGGTSDPLYRIGHEAHVSFTDAQVGGWVSRRVAEHRFLTGDDSDFDTCAARVVDIAAARAARKGRPLSERSDVLLNEWRATEQAGRADVPRAPGRRYDQDPEDDDGGACSDIRPDRQSAGLKHQAGEGAAVASVTTGGVR